SWASRRSSVCWRQVCCWRRPRPRGDASGSCRRASTAASPTGSPGRCAGSARLAIAAIVAAHVVFLLAPPLFSADVFAYVDYARLAVVHGLDPYVHGAADAPLDPVVPFVRWRDVASPYGPLFTLLSSP